MLLSVWTLKETICPKFCSKSRLKSAKGPPPVDVRRSKTSLLKVLLKIMTENGNLPPMKVISNTILFVYSLRGALIKIVRGYHTRWRNYFDWTNPVTGKIRRYPIALSYPDYNDRKWKFTSHEGNFQHHFVCLFVARRPHQNCARVSHAMAQLFRLNQSRNWKNQKVSNCVVLPWLWQTYQKLAHVDKPTAWPVNLRHAHRHITRVLVVKDSCLSLFTNPLFSIQSPLSARNKKQKPRGIY